MPIRSSAASRTGSRCLKETEGPQETTIDARQDELGQFHGYDEAHQRQVISQEALERYLERADEDEEEGGECDFLIGNEIPAAKVAQPKVISRASAQTNSDSWNSRGSLFVRLGGYLSLAGLNRAQKQQDSNSLDGISVRDLEQRADFRLGSERARPDAPQWRPSNGAHQSNHDPRLSNSSLDSARNHYDSRSQQFLTLSDQHRSCLRPHLLICLFIMLASCAALLLVRLMSLVEDERAQLGANPLRREQASSRQELILELSSQLDESHRKQLEIERLNKWLVSSPKCHIPVLEPWHPSIKEFVRRKRPMNCSALIETELSKEANSEHQNRFQLATKTLSYVQSNRLHFTERALQLGALSTVRGPGQCCLRLVSREVESDDELVYSKCEPIFLQGLAVNSSVAEVNCLAWNYTNVHSFVVTNPDEEAGLARVASRELSPDGDHYSVLMLGVDTISRLNGQRQLSKTLQVLRDLYQTLDFVGYNKVGENTFPNLIPLLTGLKPEQLTQIECWQAKNYTEESDRGDDFLDNCKYLWSFYQQAGYKTYFSEDWPEASTFNYLKPGFKYAPTTFYGRPFTLARKGLRFPRYDSIGCASCQLDRPIVDIDLENLKTFVAASSERQPYFAFHWINCPQHDDLNGASEIDHLLARFFRELRAQLERGQTFVLFFSDHGYRWNDFVSTRIGHYESSLPMMTIAPPRAFVQRHPELYANMVAHQNALLTPFDIFKTLIDLKKLSTGRLAGGSRGSFGSRPRARRQTFAGAASEFQSAEAITLDESSAESSTAASTQPPAGPATTVRQLELVDGTTFKQKFRSLSLFASHSPRQLDRGCIDAGIPDNYCVCHQYKTVDAGQLDVLAAAYYLVYFHFDSRLRNHANLCRPLQLETIHHAEMFDLEQSAATKGRTTRRRRKRSRGVTVLESRADYPGQAQQNLKTSARPANKRLRQDERSRKAGDSFSGPSGASRLEDDKHDSLPNREYSLMLSTKPGGGLFQEVVRFHGDSLDKCRKAASLASKVIEDKYANQADRRESVRVMNEDCEFSVHSESLSRFNLYRDQSRCVTSNIELKKLCYCNDLD